MGAATDVNTALTRESLCWRLLVCSKYSPRLIFVCPGMVFSPQRVRDLCLYIVPDDAHLHRLVHSDTTDGLSLVKF